MDNRKFLAKYEAFQRQLASALVDITRTSSAIAAEDPSFERSTNHTLDGGISGRTASLLHVADRLKRHSVASDQDKSVRLHDLSSLDSRWNAVVEAADNLLEQAAIALDEYRGYFRQVDVKDQVAATHISVSSTGAKSYRNFRDVAMPKPQLGFPDLNSNLDVNPFRPLLSTKPNSLEPFGSVEDFKTADNMGHQFYAHPYGSEIAAFQLPSHVWEMPALTKPAGLHSTHAVWVDTPEGLTTMLSELKEAKEIAVDLEHHDAHSYIGLVSLMQISTRSGDWIIDTLKPWRRKLEMLNEVFTNPRIIKVFHGATMDMIWLQRDFGLYVVGLFDTYHASCVLGYRGHGLAHLLKKFVDFDAQKQYQTADWRIRPLPAELFDYARSDTHFLLYIYDCIRAELLQGTQEQSLLNEVVRRSQVEALQRYERPNYETEAIPSRNGWFSQLLRSQRMESDAQLAVFTSIHKWRDDIARLEDESPHSVMPLWSFQSVVAAMPSSLTDLLRTLQPVTKFVRPRLDELLSVIQKAKANPSLLLSKTTIAMNEARAERQSLKERYTLDQIQHPDPIAAPQESSMTSTNSSFWGPLPGLHNVATREQQASHSFAKPQIDNPRLEALVKMLGSSIASVAPTLFANPIQPLGDKQIEVQHVQQRELSSLIPRPHSPSDQGGVQAPIVPEFREIGQQIDSRRSTAAPKASPTSKSTKRPHSMLLEENTPLPSFDYAVTSNSPASSHQTSSDRQPPQGTGLNPWGKTGDGLPSLKRHSAPMSGKSRTYR